MAVAHTLTLDEPVPGELVAEVTEKLAYASETLRSVRLTDDRAGVELVVDDAAQLEAASKRVLEIVNGLVRGSRETPKEILWPPPAPPPHQAPIWDDLIARGALVSSGPGCVA